MGSAKDLIDHPKEERTRQFLASYGNKRNRQTGSIQRPAGYLFL